jgi:hypothetical protein
MAGNCIRQYAEHRITAMRDFLDHLPESPNEFPWGYRGQASIKWELKPTLYRNLIDTGENSEPVKIARAYKKLENRLLMKFKAYARPHLAFEPSYDIAWLALGQHFGLPTRLLDWTENPLVAMFFALKDTTEHDAVIWACLIPWELPENEHTLDALDKTLLEGQLDEEALAQLATQNLPRLIYRYHPSHTTNRITVQQGFFTIQSFGGNPLGNLYLQPLEEQCSLDLSLTQPEQIEDSTGPWFRKYIILYLFNTKSRS